MAVDHMLDPKDETQTIFV